MKTRFLFYCYVLIGLWSVTAQHSTQLKAYFSATTNLISIEQKIIYKNTSSDSLTHIYLQDWMHAFSGKNTILAKRRDREFNTSLSFANAKKRGYTKIQHCTDYNAMPLEWEILDTDHVKIVLNTPLAPFEKQEFTIHYSVKIPDAMFTRYGVVDTQKTILKNWYLSPSRYQNKAWELQNETDLKPLHTNYTQTDIVFTAPKNYQITTELTPVKHSIKKDVTTYHFKGKQTKSYILHLEKNTSFTNYTYKNTRIYCNLKTKKLTSSQKTKAVKKVMQYIENTLGLYPYKNLVISNTAYQKKPLYGLQQLPKQLQIFPEDFLYELQLLKTALYRYTAQIPSYTHTKDWLIQAIPIYYIMQYVDLHYPKMSLCGNFANTWGIKNYSLAKTKFNQQYTLFYFLMARQNIDQTLESNAEDLIKFNANITNAYKGALGLRYLESYIGEQHVGNALKKIFKNNNTNITSATIFQKNIEKSSNKNLDWFFTDYIKTTKKIDYTITRVKKQKDSLFIHIKNKEDIASPITLFSLKNDTVISKRWITGFKGTKTIKTTRDKADKLVLNYDQKIPEYIQSNNWKSLKKLAFLHKPIKPQLFKDIENPRIYPLFYIPAIDFNIYDGITPAIRLHNKNILPKPFIFDIQPGYASKEKKLVGSARLKYTQYAKNQKNSSLYKTIFSVFGSRFHYNTNAMYSTFSPSITLVFRPKNRRKNQREYVSIRNVSIFREKQQLLSKDKPDYSIVNLRYTYTNAEATKQNIWYIDTEIAPYFTKLTYTLQYKTTLKNNKQLNFRIFAGTFLSNFRPNTAFFNFALDRPTDYLFQYDYLGRSEGSGIYSQQFIAAEGGFKSKLPNSFSNQWIATTNTSFTLWRWIEAYTDIGVLKNRNKKAALVYDSGIRLNFVENYFELYLPIHASTGWEITPHKNYAEKIRFSITLSPNTLIRLFTRKWF